MCRGKKNRIRDFSIRSFKFLVKHLVSFRLRTVCSALFKSHIQLYNSSTLWCEPRFGSRGLLPSWINTGIWIGKILSIWPFENSTTALCFWSIKQSPKFDLTIKTFHKNKNFPHTPLHNKIFIFDLSSQVLEGSIFSTVQW